MPAVSERLLLAAFEFFLKNFYYVGILAVESQSCGWFFKSGGEGLCVRFLLFNK